jgi:hypothetical protein
MTDDYAPDEFVLTYPVWIVFDAAVLEARGVEESLLHMEDDQGRKFPVIFSDSDLAIRAAKQDGRPTCGARELSKSELLGFLTGLEEYGFTHIAIDPSSSTRARIGPIAEIKRAIEEPPA